MSIFQQKCVDFNQRLGPKICGFDPYIKTIYGPDIQYNPYMVATRNIVKKIPYCKLGKVTYSILIEKSNVRQKS